jgi:hypothetical protein
MKGTHTALRDTILTHPTLVEGLIPLFSSAPSSPKFARRESAGDPEGPLAADQLRCRLNLLYALHCPDHR